MTAPEGNETTEAFTERMVAAIDSASLTILVSVGHQTGLLETMAKLAPSTSARSRTRRGSTNVMSESG